jgi:two-component system, LuxR family, response regulator FixJ
MSNSTPHIYLVEDDVALCRALEWLFQSINLLSKTFNNGKDFLEYYNSELTGCILADIRMPKMSGLELQERLNARHNRLPIIFISGHGDIALSVRAMKTGAFDFISKPFNNQNLIEQIQKAIEKNTKDFVQKENRSFALSCMKLTRRESEVLHHVVDGKLNKQISSMLEVSISTVEMHRANIMKKLGVQSVAKLIENYTKVNMCKNCIYGEKVDIK